MIFKPHKYQHSALAFILSHKYAGLFADPGMGKTAIMLSFIKLLKKKALIIAPLRVCYSVWPEEIKKWDQFNNLEYKILHGKTRVFENQKQIEIINPEGLKWFLQGNIKDRYDILIIDESTKFKNWSAIRTKLLKKELQFFDRRYILTGTPTPNSLMDLFSQIYLLDMGEALGKYIGQYRSNYFISNQYMKFTTYDLKPHSEKLINHKIKPFTFRLDAKDHLKLPPIIYNDIYFKLSSNSKKIYSDMEKDLVAEIKDAKTLAGSAAVAYGKCRQIVSGQLYDEEKKVLTVHKEKIEVLKDLLDELHGKPTLIAYHYKHELDVFKKIFGDIEYIDGSISPKKSNLICEKWNSGKILKLFCHPKSVAHGLNLQAGGNDVIYYTLTDEYENYEQLNRRIYRQNVKGTVRIHHLIAKNTVDELILNRLRYKGKMQETLLDYLKRNLLNQSIKQNNKTSRNSDN